MGEETRRQLLVGISGVLGAFAGCQSPQSVNSRTPASSNTSTINDTTRQSTATESSTQTSTESSPTFSQKDVESLKLVNQTQDELTAHITISESKSDTVVFDRSVTLQYRENKRYDGIFDRQTQYVVEVVLKSGGKFKKKVRTGSGGCGGITIYFDSNNKVSIIVLCY